MSNEITFDGACRLLETILKGSARREIVADLSKSKNFSDALRRLRDSMRSHLFKAGSQRFSLGKFIKKFDNQTRQEGFHALHDWDGKADKLNKDIIPVDVLHYFMGTAAVGSEPKALAILLDYYFIYVLGLLSLSAWRDGDVNDNLDRIGRLLQHLQGPDGSGHQFAGSVASVIFISTSHYEPDDTAYERLLARVRTLNPSRQLATALVHAGILGSHLRYGFEYFYKRDIVLMRKDNAPDYPWLSFSLATLIKAYAGMCEEGIRGIERDRIVEGILNGLSPDARAFVGKAPDSLSAHELERSQFAELFQRYRENLFEEFERFRPSEETYSAIAFGFNFPHNIVKAMVANAITRGEPSKWTLNDLLTGVPRDDPAGRSKQVFTESIVDYASSSPDTIGGRPVPIIVYDAYSGLLSFAKAIKIAKELTSS